jgi:polyisoprenoid-binding protein YceI
MNPTALALVLTLAAAPPFHLTKVPASATFLVLGPANIPIVGTTPDVAVQDDGRVIDVVVDLRELDTGMKFRDDHMRNKYLEVARFPDTRLHAERAALLPVPTGTVVNGKAIGDLTLHGVTKRVPFSYRVSCTADEVCDVRAHVKLDMEDFGVVVAPYFGLRVQREVAIDVAFQVSH